MKNIRIIRLLYIFSALLLCSSSYGRTVRGQVTSGEDKLSDVTVTDGTNFTKTNKKGAFKMKIDDNAKFVYVITPSGYVADWSSGAPQFYQKADQGDFFAFDLIRTGMDYSTYHLIAVGDPQPRHKTESDEFEGAPVEDMRSTIAQMKEPAVGLILGDLCFDVFPLMIRTKNTLAGLGIPFYSVPGNHDHDRKVEGNDNLATRVYNEHFGPENYAFHLGNDLVIMLDNIIYHNRSGYEEGYTEDQLKWVKSLLKTIPSDADLFIVQHSPLNGRSPVRHTDEVVVNRDKLFEIIKGRKTTFISGHNHTNGNYTYGPDIMDHNVAAISGSWWDSYRCKDGTPRGYKVFTKTGKDLKWYYKSIGKDKDFQYDIVRKGEGQLHPDCILVNIWDYDPQWKVEWMEDGKPMGQMTQVEEYSPQHKAEIKALQDAGKNVKGYRLTIKSKHFFAARPSENASKVSIKITDRFGKTWTEDIVL